MDRSCYLIIYRLDELPLEQVLEQVYFSCEHAAVINGQTNGDILHVAIIDIMP